jgi:hypothetical protein
MTPGQVRRGVALGVVGTLLPLMADAVTEPYARRGPAVSWAYGAAKLALPLSLAWALRVLAEADRSSRVCQIAREAGRDH